VNFSKYTQEFSYNLRLAYPIILGMLGHTIVGIVDNVMVGQIGPTELAAVSLGIVLFYSLVIRYWFSTAITPLAAETDGLIMLRRKKCISSWIIFMHDFRFHFISDYILLSL
jgi:MATE family multidrug resistance protein